MGGGGALRRRARRARRASIRPALERGEDVVCDRYLDSSVAYQGGGRGLGEERVLELNLLVTGGLLPDRTFVVLLDPDAARRRRAATTTTGSSARATSSCAASTRPTARSLRTSPERVVAVDGDRATRRDRGGGP